MENGCKKSLNTIGLILLALASFVLLGMGPGEKKGNESLEPSYSPLEEGQERFLGVVQTEDAQTSLKDLSFTGTTKLTGLRKEKDKSYNDIDLFVVSKIVVKEPDYRSTEHSNAPGDPLFIKAAVTFNSGVTEEYLLPHKLEVSGIEANTGVEKTWRLRSIKELQIVEKKELHVTFAEEQEQAIPEKVVQGGGIVSRVFNKVKQAGRYIKSSLF